MISTMMGSDTSRETRRDRAIRRIALYLDRPARRVAANPAGAIRDVLCSLPWGSRLRRDRDRILVDDVRFLFDGLEADDPRRPTLKYLLEHNERRTRL